MEARVAPGQECSHVEAAVLYQVKRSPAYRALHHRFAGPRPPQPSESWVEGNVSYVVFDLLPEDGQVSFAPLALFAVHRQQNQILFVRLVTPDPITATAHVTELNH